MTPNQDERQAGGQIRSVNIRVPGALALLLAVPVLLLAGLLAIAGLLAGVAALVLMPWLTRRLPRSFEEETTITLDPTAYRHAEGDGGRAVGRLLMGPRTPAHDESADGQGREHAPGAKTRTPEH